MRLNWTLLPICLAATACASGGRHIVDSERATQDLPDDLATRFRLEGETLRKAQVPPAALPQIKAIGSVEAAAPVVPAKAAMAPPSPAHAPKAAHFSWPSRRPKQEPFWVGEKAVYEITYFGVPAAYFTMGIMPLQSLNGRKVYHSHITVESHPLFRFIYRIDDQIDTYFDYQGLFSHRFQMSLDESKQKRDTVELYDHEAGQMFYRNNWIPNDQPPKRSEGYFPMPRFAQDSISALYYLRGIPLAVGDSFEFEVAQEGKHFQSLITVEAREKMHSKLGDKDVLRLRLGARINGQIRKPDDNFLWLTDDDRRVVVRLEAKVKIGTLAAVLSSFEPGESPNPQITPIEK